MGRSHKPEKEVEKIKYSGCVFGISPKSEPKTKGQPKQENAEDVHQIPQIGSVSMQLLQSRLSNDLKPVSDPITSVASDLYERQQLCPEQHKTVKLRRARQKYSENKRKRATNVSSA